MPHNDAAYEWPDGHFSSESRRGLSLREDPQSILPPLAGLGQSAQPELKDRLLSALLGFQKSSQAAQEASRLGDPLTAALAAIGGAAGAPGGEAVARARRAEEQKSQLAQLESTPIDAISPDIVKEFPEMAGVPVGLAKQFFPLIAESGRKKRADMLAHARTGAAGSLYTDPDTGMAFRIKSGMRGNELVPLPGQSIGPDGKVVFNVEDREYRRQERRTIEKERIVDRFNADQSVRRAQQAVDGANIVEGLLDSNNPIAAAAIPTFMARASGEVGNLSEFDKKPFGGSRALLARLEQAATEATTGRLSSANARFVRELSAVMSKRAFENIDALAKKRAKQYGRASDFLDEKEIYSVLQPDTIGEKGVIRRMGKPKGYSKSIPLISTDGGKTWGPE